MSFTQDMIAKAPDVAARLKLLSNPNRLLIVCRLLDGELSVGDIETELGIRQPTLSRELGHLRDADIISPRRQSKVVFYSLTNTSMRRLIEVICETSSDGKRRAPSQTGSMNTPKTIAFNPRPKFMKSGPTSENERGYSMFAATHKKGA